MCPLNIAKLIERHSEHTCENKLKYLKAKYLQKKDNMSNKSSGARSINFDYFDELDEIFGKEPIVTPVAIASSSRLHTEIDFSEEQAGASQTQEPSPRYTSQTRRNTKLREALSDLNSILKKSEEDKQK